MTVKFVSLLKRRPGMSREEFIDYHRDSHLKIFMADPTIRRLCRRYVQSHPVTSGIEGLPDPQFDGVVEAWFDNVEDLREAFSSETYMVNIRTSELKFIDVEHTVNLVTEEDLAWPE